MLGSGLKILRVMKRPVLVLQTIYFHESDREEARRLGGDLYERLTRPIDDPLAHGPGIPVLVGVHAESVDVEAADTVVLIPVLGTQSRGLMKDRVLDVLKQWHMALGPGHILPVPVSANWRADEDELPGKQMLSMLYAKADPRCVTLDEIVLAVTRLWELDRGNVQLFISHAKADLVATDEVAKKIHTFVTNDTTGKAFFDANDLRPGESLDEQLDTAATRGVLISVRGDAYSSRVWCQREVLLAKLNGMPTLSVEVLRRGELRSSPYGGNSPTMVWDSNPSRVVSQAMVEWLRAGFFRREAVRIIEAANLPKDVAVVARPPELLDLAQGPLRSDRAQLVLHPDPELSVLERRVLKAARPRLHLATPTTAFRRLLSRRDESADVASPLEGMQIAMSLSATPDSDKAVGFTHNHVVDATVHIARTLISAGAAIAYGGDFRTGAKAFTPLLAQLIQTYNQTASKRAHDLHSYLAAIIPLGEAPADIPLRLHHLKESPDLAKEALWPIPHCRTRRRLRCISPTCAGLWRNVSPRALSSAVRRILESKRTGKAMAGVIPEWSKRRGDRCSRKTRFTSLADSAARRVWWPICSREKRSRKSFATPRGCVTTFTRRRPRNSTHIPTEKNSACRSAWKIWPRRSRNSLSHC
jgi:hypothetical protein